jgi:hypothetical protein
MQRMSGNHAGLRNGIGGDASALSDGFHDVDGLTPFFRFLKNGITLVLFQPRCTVGFRLGLKILRRFSSSSIIAKGSRLRRLRWLSQIQMAASSRLSNLRSTVRCSCM